MPVNELKGNIVELTDGDEIIAISSPLDLRCVATSHGMGLTKREAEMLFKRHYSEMVMAANLAVKEVALRVVRKYVEKRRKS